MNNFRKLSNVASGCIAIYGVDSLDHPVQCSFIEVVRIQNQCARGNALVCRQNTARHSTNANCGTALIFFFLFFFFFFSVDLAATLSAAAVFKKQCTNHQSRRTRCSGYNGLHYINYDQQGAAVYVIHNVFHVPCLGAIHNVFHVPYLDARALPCLALVE